MNSTEKNFQRLTISGFLEVYYPDPDEPVHLRFFKPRDAEKNNRNKPEKLTITRSAIASDQPTQQRLKALNESRGAYFVVNAGGDKDVDINRFNAFFVENDTKAIKEQHAALDRAPLSPSIRVETKKSVHAYWLIEGNCTAEQWREVQKRLIAFFDGDSAIKNPSRVMRLPGLDHISTDGSRKRVECVSFEPESRYTAERMLEAFQPTPGQKPQIVRANNDRAVDERERKYALAALAEEELRVRSAANGKRNDTLNQAAFSLGQIIGAGRLSESLVEATLTDAAQSAGLRDSEIRATLKSGLEAGRKEPRRLPENSRTQSPIVDANATEAVSPQPFINRSLFDGKLKFELSPSERGKVKLTARNGDGVLHRDVISLDKLEDRAKFIKQLNLNKEEQGQALQTLLALADESDQLRVNQSKDVDSQTKKVIFAALPDGRLIEQIAGCKFAVFDPQSGEVNYLPNVTTEGVLYSPLDDDFVLKGGLQLPERLTEYGDDAALDAEIEAVIRRYSDVPPRELGLSAKYVRLSYIADKLQEISYLRATGERGSGKSRYISTTGMLCLRPILITSPSAASLYRMMDAYQPTLIIDECNFEQGSEDTTALMQILNSGFQRVTYVPRMDRSADGQMTLRMFSAFGPKLIGSLKLSDSPAFESRCVAVSLKKTARMDIPFRMTERMLRDFAALREKLYLWRLRNWLRDFEQDFDDAERELKKRQIEPRFIQIAIPLYGMLASSDLKNDFARMLETRTEDAANDKKDSLDGQLVSIIHDLLFNVEGEVAWKTENGLVPEEGKPIESATIERITDAVNANLPEKKKLDSRWIGKQIVKIGFKRREITNRKSENRKKSAVVFDRQTFADLFANLSLPLPQDFYPATSGQTDNANKNNALDWPDQPENEQYPSISPGQANQLQDNNLASWSDVAGSKMQEMARMEDVETF